MKCPACGKRLWLIGMEQSNDRIKTQRYHECRNEECGAEMKEYGTIHIVKPPKKILSNSTHFPLDSHCNTQ